MGQLFLVLTIIFESAAVIFMKLSNGFQYKFHAAVAVVAYLLSFIFLTLALKQLQAGVANAIWAGASILLVAILGIFIFKEQLNTMQWICLVLIVAGIAGLHIAGS